MATKQLKLEDFITQMTYSSKVSKLFANENISVKFSEKAETASFAPKERILTYPYNSLLLDEDINMLFTMHEISHAIHLPENIFETIKKSKCNPGIFNVIIDIRDERLIKEKYPASSKIFLHGYAKLIEDKFFGETSTLKYTNFANRLNFFAKCGPILSSKYITLSDTELVFYHKCYAASTIEQCIELSKELSTLVEEELVEDDIQKLDDFINNQDDDDNEEGSDFSSEQNEDIADDNTPGTQSVTRSNWTKEDYDKLRKEMPNDVMEKSFKKNNISNNVNIINFVSPKYVYSKSTYTYDKYINANYHEQINAKMKEFKEYRSSIDNSIAGMVKTFESKKAAKQYKDSLVSQTGKLNIDRVIRYKFDDRIFKTKTHIPTAKNHGYIILVDFSGSMSNTFNNVCDQLFVLIEFFRKINVQYKIFSFGGGFDAVSPSSERIDKPSVYSKVISNGIKIERNGNIEIFNSEQSKAQSAAAMIAIREGLGYGLGHTPTGNAMIAIEDTIKEFVVAKKIEKTHLICITDGEAGDIANPYGSYIVTDAQEKSKIIIPHVSHYSMIDTIGKIYSNRYGIKFTTLHISYSCSSSVCGMYTHIDISEDKSTNFRKNGYHKIIMPYTKNEVFIVKPISTENEYDLSAVDSSTSTNKISRTMISQMKGIKKSRIFLNAIIESLSV